MPHCLLRPELVHKIVKETKVQQQKSPARTFTSLAGQMLFDWSKVACRTPGSKQIEEDMPADNTLLLQVIMHGADDSSSWFSPKMGDHLFKEASVLLWSAFGLRPRAIGAFVPAQMHQGGETRSSAIQLDV